ncbi:hypothetical protein [Lelliottia amnigena]|uniref:hypothetical protein n=1 Tax=Lelliottia amnigena TaxID=61646 RepID=UPI003BA214CC
MTCVILSVDFVIGAQNTMTSKAAFTPDSVILAPKKKLCLYWFQRRKESPLMNGGNKARLAFSFYGPGQALSATKKLPYLLYCYLLIIHLCGAKKNKIHRNPGQ